MSPLTLHRPVRRLSRLGLALLLPCVTLLSALPARAWSALSAWAISRDGVLELRTPPATRLQAFFEEGSAGMGPRIWVDLPGAPQRSRTLAGNGAIR